MLRPFYTDRPDEYSSFDSPEVSKGEEVVLQDRDAGGSRSQPSKTSEPQAAGANGFGKAGTGPDALGAKSNSSNRNPQRLLATNPVLDIYPPESFADQPATMPVHHARSPRAELMMNPTIQAAPPIADIAASARTKQELGQRKPIVSMTSEIVKKVQGMPHKESLNIN